MTIQPSEYLQFGTIVTGGEPKPEDPTRYRAVEVDEADVLARYGWTRDELADASWRYGFPKRDRTVTRIGRPYGLTSVPSWRLTSIEQWEAGIREMAGRLPRR